MYGCVNEKMKKKTRKKIASQSETQKVAFSAVQHEDMQHIYMYMQSED